MKPSEESYSFCSDGTAYREKMYTEMRDTVPHPNGKKKNL